MERFAPAKFIDFDENIINFYKSEVLECIKSVDYPIYIMSFVGEARFGKSSLLNCFITFLLKKNSTIFKTSSLNKHCTIGIDMYIVKREEECFGYLLLDCQGINHGDSSNDCKLMLLAYELSNVIIYNDKKLNNSTLKGLESMNLFERYMPNIHENLNRPILIFRTRDYELEDKIEDVLNDLLILRNDQYDTIRRTINKLYSSVLAFSTNSLSRDEKIALSNQEYDIILLSEDTEFAKFCENIEKTVLITKPIILTKEHIDTIDETVDKINKDKKIDYKLLDISALNLHKDLSEFMSEVDRSLFDELSVPTGTQDGHEFVKNKIDLLDIQINKFNVLFDKCDHTITEKYIVKLYEQNQKLDIYIKKNKNLAMRDVFGKMQDIIFKYNFSNFTTQCSNFCADIIDEIVDDIKKKYDEILISCVSHVFNSMFINLKTILTNIYNDHVVSINEYLININDILKNMLIIKNIISHDNIDIQIKYENQNFIKDTIDKFNEEKPIITDEIFFTFALKLKPLYSFRNEIKIISGFDFEIQKKNQCKINEDLYHKHYVDIINKFFTEKYVLVFYDVLIRKKISGYLNNIINKKLETFDIDNALHYDSIPIVRNIIENNPNINFIFPRKFDVETFRIGVESKFSIEHLIKYIEYRNKICKYYNITINEFDQTNIFIEEEYEKIFNAKYEVIDKRFTYKNLIKNKIKDSNTFNYVLHKSYKGEIVESQSINNLSNLYSWSISFETNMVFHNKVEDYYKQLEKQYEDEEFNRLIIGSSE
jgi:hypothetical protein